MKKILIFAPHGSYQVHHQLDAVVGAALGLRGCEVRVVICDQLFSDCYIAGRPFNPDTCAHCVAAGVQLYQALRVPITPLKALLDDGALRTAQEWAASVDLENFQKAMFEGEPVGQWVGYGLYAYFKSSRLVFSDPEISRVARSALRNGALIVCAMKRLLTEYRPDHCITYQGGHSYYRVFYELMREQDIPVLVHERGYTDDSFLLLSNRSNYEMNYRSIEEWENWRDVPLTERELEAVDTLMCAREQGQNMNFVQFSGFARSASTLRERLRIPPAAPILALFGSGDWEVGMYKSYGPLKMAHRSQLDWIRHSAEIARQLGMYVVIRHHPLGAGTESYPRAAEFLGELIEFNQSLGDNVRVVMPYEKISSYDLMWHADAVASLFSTTSVESVIRGIGGVTTGHSVYQPAGVLLADSPERYESALRKAVATTHEGGKAPLKTAYRFLNFVYHVAFSQRFKSFGIKNVYERDIRVQSFEELVPGRDPTLDRVCAHILEGNPLYELPTGERTEAAENRYLEKVAARNRENRELARGRIHGALLAQPPRREVLVVPIVAEGSAVPNELLRNCARSRHRELKLTDPISLSGGDLSELLHLKHVVSAADSEFVWCALGGIEIDECGISSAVDALTASSEAKLASFGAYQLRDDGSVGDEFATAIVQAPDYNTACERFPFLRTLAALLSLTLWRREALEFWLEESVRKASFGLSLRESLYGVTFFGDLNVRVSQPLISFSPRYDLNGETERIREENTVIETGGRLSDLPESGAQAR